VNKLEKKKRKKIKNRALSIKPGSERVLVLLGDWAKEGTENKEASAYYTLRGAQTTIHLAFGFREVRGRARRCKIKGLTKN